MNPFLGPHCSDAQTKRRTADDRIQMVRDFDRTQCEAALKVTSLQRTVRRAVLVRLKKLRAFDREFAQESARQLRALLTGEKKC